MILASSSAAGSIKSAVVRRTLARSPRVQRLTRQNVGSEAQSRDAVSAGVFRTAQPGRIRSLGACSAGGPEGLAAFAATILCHSPLSWAHDGSLPFTRSAQLWQDSVADEWSSVRLPSKSDWLCTFLLPDTVGQMVHLCSPTSQESSLRDFKHHHALPQIIDKRSLESCAPRSFPFIFRVPTISDPRSCFGFWFQA